MPPSGPTRGRLAGALGVTGAALLTRGTGQDLDSAAEAVAGY